MLVLAALGVLALPAGLLAQAPPPPDAKAWVKQHDKNSDSQIDREEFHQAAVI